MIILGVLEEAETIDGLLLAFNGQLEPNAGEVYEQVQV
jgi:hypothetical protein